MMINMKEKEEEEDDEEEEYGVRHCYSHHMLYIKSTLKVLTILNKVSKI